MAGCSILTNGSALDCVEIASAYQNNGSCVASDDSVEDVAVVGIHDSHDDFKVKLRGLFDQVLSVFLFRQCSVMGGPWICLDFSG
jgi:hypothetical protein